MKKPKTSILIVEDDGIIAQNLEELLTSFGYQVHGIASTAQEAVLLATERCPDIVLMDIRIKGERDGIDTATILGQRFDVPIIYLTAHADEATIERAKPTRPYGYLVKPIRPLELQSAIEIARYKHSMDRLLRAREHWYATTMRSIADAVIAVDLTGKITFMNPAAELLLDMPFTDAEGRPARDVLRLLDSESRHRDDTPLDQALREKRPVHVTESVLKTATSNKIITDSAAPVVDGGEVLGAVMVFRDVTEWKAMQRRLELADRLASLGTMAAGVAHEINNPLSVVIANAELVLEHLEGKSSPPAPEPEPASPPRSSFAEVVKAQADLLSAAGRIAKIVSDLKAFSRPDPLVSGWVDVRKPIEWAIRSTAREFRHRARVTTRLADLPRVAADETRLGQVLVNLLINAAQAIPPGNVSANEVSITTRTDEGHVVIEIRDTGPGMPPEVVSRIFEPFFTTKPPGIGTGLGLSICHGIVASMGGALSVESRVGEGTTFRVALPASIEQEARPSRQPEPTVDGRRGRILCIDDEEMILNVLRRVLSEHDVVCVQNAKDALRLLEAGQKFDIIFCDLMMPTMTGMDLYEVLLRRSREVARSVVFMTGGAVGPKLGEFLQTVTNECVEKPFNVGTLRAMAQRLLRAPKG